MGWFFDKEKTDEVKETMIQETPVKDIEYTIKDLYYKSLRTFVNMNGNFHNSYISITCDKKFKPLIQKYIKVGNPNPLDSWTTDFKLKDKEYYTIHNIMPFMFDDKLETDTEITFIAYYSHITHTTY